jgi:hypothetical protein
MGAEVLFSGSGAPSRAQQRDCRSSIAVAKPWPSAMNSRISDSGVAREDSTSPMTPPKSKDSSASNLRASCCMRRFSARQAMCSSRKLRLRAASKVQRISAEPTP